jgi:WD40 repeat protein
VEWSPNGERLAAISFYLCQDTAICNVQIRNIKTDETERKSDIELFPNTIAWSPDGTQLLVGTGDFVHDEGYVIAWDVETGEHLYTLSGHQQPVTDLEWSSDGTVLLSSSGTSPVEFPGHGFSQGSYDGSIVLWDMDSREPLDVLEGHTAEVQGLALSPDGTTLASGSADGTVILWDIASILESP